MNIFLINIFHLRMEERQWEAWHCFFATKFSKFGRKQDGTFRRQSSSLSFS